MNPDVQRTSSGHTTDSPRTVHTQTEMYRGKTPDARTDALSTRGRVIEESVTSRIRRVPQADALARLIADIRPDWPVAEVHAWALRDERPWADVVAAGINGARDRSIRHVGGLAFTGPMAATVAQSYPTVAEALEPLDARLCSCGSGSLRGACPPHRTQEDR